MARHWNPPNRFDQVESTWDQEPPDIPVEVREEVARSLLSENDSPDLPFRFSVNPYRGCQHACIYCYARPFHEYLGLGAGTDFERRLVVKVNAPTLLRRELRRATLTGEVLAFSGVTDCYQPLEHRFELTRRCLDVCREARQPVSILTRSPLVLRDLDLLEALHERGGAQVAFSIPFASEATARALEPGAPPLAERWRALQTVAQRGIPVGVMVAPLIPGLNDREIPAILEEAAARGARSAGLILLRLPGAVEPWFWQRLEARLPSAVRGVRGRWQDSRSGPAAATGFGRRMVGNGAYWDTMERWFHLMARRAGLETRGEGIPPLEQRDSALHRPE